MSGLEDLRLRLNYRGGGQQQKRMIEDKLKSLKKALLYSYQACTAIIPDGREFRCLLNPDKLKPDYDNKIISIPFEDICLNSERIGKTSEGIEVIGLKPGDVFQCKEDGSYWIVYLQYREELAYFRAAVRRCDYEVDVNGQNYHIYLQGPLETDINWNQKAQIEWNNLNYQIMIYITEDENTLDFFHRFAKIKIDGKQYQVSAVNSYKAEGIIQVYLQEYYTNTIEDEGYNPPQQEEIEVETGIPSIVGDTVVKPYSVVTYQGESLPSGHWEIDNIKKAKIIDINNSFEVTIEIIAGKSGNFNLIYKDDNNEEVVSLPIKIISL